MLFRLVFASPLPLLGQSGGGRKVEAIAATKATKEMLWMKRFLCQLRVRQDEYVVFCDSQSAMDLRLLCQHCGIKMWFLALF